MNDESPITTPRDIPISSLVPHWLSECNLSYAIPNFEMAGIITPRSFAELELSYFEPLGVTKAEDRKNLFYLVQHVKKEIANGEIAKREAKEKENGNDNRGDNIDIGEGGQQKHDEEEDEYADEFHSPTNSRSRVNDYINGGMDNNIGKSSNCNNNNYEGGRDNMMSTVVHNNLMEPISPVTISSPIASVVGEDHHHVRHGINNGRGGAVKKLALGGAVGKKDLSTERSSKPTPREILEKELELRRLNRQEQRLLEKRGGQNNDINSDDYQEEEEREKKQKSKTKRRQSFLPSVSGNSRISSTRRSSIASSSYRSTASSVASSVVKNDKLDELGSLLDDDEEKKSSDVDSYNNFDYDDSRITTPKTVASVVDARSRRSSIHHRQTVKKTNATRGGGGGMQRVKNRRYSNIPRAAPLLNDDDDESLMSDTSDLSASVSSFRSSSTRRSSIASVSTTGAYSSSRSGLSGVSKSLVDENSYGNVERTNRRQSLTKRPGSGNGVGGTNSSVASLRTGKKRLSTIPSSSIAPLSPLVGLSSTQLDQSMASQSMKVATATGSRNPRRRSSIGSSRSASSRPGTADSSGSKKQATNNLKQVKPVGGTVGSPNSTTSASISSYRERPSSRSSMDGSQKQRLLRSDNKKKLNVSSSSNKTNTSGASSSSSVKQRQRVKSPAPRSINPRSRSKSPLPRGSARTQPSRSPLSSRGGMSPRRNQSPTPRNRAVSPMRSHRAPTSPKSLGVVGNRPLSPIRSPTRGRATSPKSPRRVKSPVGIGAVFVHGAVADNSWGTQIGQLRENFDTEHAEHMTTRKPEEEDDEYEMRIRVIVRKRPMSKKEASDGGEVDVIHPLDYDDYGRILVHQPKTKLDLTKEVETTSFAFDNVFDEHSNNSQIYERAVQGLIPGVFRGKWASVFAYGQTGSGKTFTMMGSNATGMRAGNQAENNMSDTNLGLYFLAAQDVFRIAEDPAYADISIGVSLFEIYGGKLLDLLNERNPVRCLEDRKGKVCFPGLSEHPVTNANELMDIIDAGALNRSTGTTSANADSSRSHAVLQLSLRKDVGRTKNKEHSRLTFIDLAGSERGADTSKACRTTRMEGAEINTSLLALKEVIRALATGSSLKRIPFRGSKLTQVLKESFVGKNSRTVMVSCVAPNMKNCDHTLNTLRYADRVKERDPQTGKLSASVAASSNIKIDQADMIRVKVPPRPLTAPAASFRIEREDDDVSSDDDDIPPPPPSSEELFLQSLDEDDENDNAAEKSGYYSEFDVDKVVDSDENDSLEEVLKSNDNLPPANIPEHSQPIQRTLKDNPAAQTLIATHKSIMSKLLQMLQHEMTLVNDTDANRENIDAYLKELEQLSDEQLSLLSTLRESLASYNASTSNNGANTHTSTLNDTLDGYEDSFDLRD